MTNVGLQGRLADFTLADILQLIALQQKTGLLTVDASYPMVLAFEAGMLVGYRDVRRLGSDPLENFLKSYGFFGSETWEHIDFVQRHSKLDLTEILVNEGVLDADELAALQLEATQEDIFRGMQLRDGRYNFMPGRDGMAGLKGRVRIKVDGLLMEAVRRIDELSALRERFFSLDLKIRLTDPEADTSERSATERRIISLLARNQTLRQIIAQARLCEFDTMSTLDHLLGAGIIAIQSSPRVQEQEKESVERDPRRNRRFRRTLAVVVSVSIMTIAISVWQPWASYRDVTAASNPGQLYRDARDRARLEAAVQLFEQLHERLPKSIEQLGQDGWVPMNELSDLDARFELRIDRQRWSVEPRRQDNPSS